MARLDFRYLGPFQVINEEPLPLGGPRQRAVLVLLLMNRGETITADRMIDELWGEHPPSTVSKAIHVYVSNLRKVIGDGVLLTQDGGYAINVEPDQVDADRFEDLVARGRTALERGYPFVARQRLREALGLWRGRPLADFSYHQFAQAEIARLEEARVAALEDRIDADLAVGGHLALVPELETHVRAHPARERLWGQLMVALYRSGRQADALERYRRARRILIDEFAIEPGRELKEIERAILIQDPTLDPPALPPNLESAPPRTGQTPASPPGQDLGTSRHTDGARDDLGAPPSRAPASRARLAAALHAARLTIAEPLKPRLAHARRVIDAHWPERRRAIASGAALLLAAVIVVAVLTTGGGSKRQPVAHPLTGCSGCVASISAPRSGSFYMIGQSVITSFSCADRSRGQRIVSCDDSTGHDTADGGHGQLDTSTPGTHIYTVTATANGGASRASSVSYTVVAPRAMSIASVAAAVSHHRTRIVLRCSGGRPGSPCHGVVRLRIRRLILGHVVMATVARAGYSAPPGTLTPIMLRLNRAGMLALRHAAGHHRRAQVIATLAGSRAAQRWIRLGLAQPRL
jgi:DNA-binding SARP family transcriptional activator